MARILTVCTHYYHSFSSSCCGPFTEVDFMNPKFKVGDIIIPLRAFMGIYFGRITEISISRDEVWWTDQDGSKWVNSVYIIEKTFRIQTPLDKLL